MASPTVAATAESSTNTAGTSHVVTLPTGITSGDLLIVMLDKGSTSATVNALTGWTELLDEASANGLYIAYRLADGSEGSSITLTTSASTRSAQIVYRITGAIDPGTQAPQIGTTATGTSVSPDPPSVTPTGGAKDYLWIAFFGMAGEEADDDTWANTPPTNYTPSPPDQKSCGTAGTNLGGLIAVASRQLNASTENPGTFNVDVSAAWRAQTIAVHPNPDATAHPSTVAAVAGVSTPIVMRPLGVDLSRATVLPAKATRVATIDLTTAPANSLAVLVCWGDADNGVTNETFSVTSSGGLTWTKQVEANGSPGGVATVFSAPITSAGDYTGIQVTDSDAFGDSQSQMAVRPLIFVDLNGQPAFGASVADTASITTTVNNSWVWLHSMADTGGTTNGTQIVVYNITGGAFDGGDNISLTRLIAFTATAGTVVTPTQGGNHGTIFEITPASLSGDATATPSTVAALAGVGAAVAQGGAKVAPSVVTTVAGVGTATAQGGALATPGVVAAVATIPAPSVLTGGSATASPSTVAVTTTITTPAVRVGVTVAPMAVVGVAAVGATTIKTGSTISVATVAAVATVPTPSVGGSTIVTPATVAVVATAGTPTMHMGAVPAPATVQAVALVGSSSIKTGSTVIVVTVTAGASITTPTVVLSFFTTRPNTGITARPNTGTTVRPDSGITARPNTGITPRPDTGTTPQH